MLNILSPSPFSLGCMGVPTLAAGAGLLGNATICSVAGFAVGAIIVAVPLGRLRATRVLPRTA